MIWPTFWHCFLNISSRTTLITSIFVVLKSTNQYLQGDIGIKWVGYRLCTSNFGCVHYFVFGHASRQMGSTRPHRPQFLLHEGKVWKDKRTESIFSTVGLVLMSIFVQSGVESERVGGFMLLVTMSSMPPTWVEGRLACLGPSYRCTCLTGYTDLG